MTALICLRGLPGSGKSTIAKQILAEKDNVIRLNRDDLRASLFNGEGVLPFEQEEMITKIQREAAAAALRAGKHVLVDDTNLRTKYVKQWNVLALEHGAGFMLHDVHTPVDECVRRDSVRERTVGETVIRDLAKKFYSKDTFPEYEPIEAVPAEPAPVTYDDSLEDIVLVDIDGTVTLGPHERGPFEWSKVGQDLPRWRVIELVRTLMRDGKQIVFMSGRSDVCYVETERWLWKHGLADRPITLHMRKDGDFREDNIIKRELFDRHIRNQYNAILILDDRDQVVRMWRKDLNLTCLQVDYGAF